LYLLLLCLTSKDYPLSFWEPTAGDYTGSDHNLPGETR